MSLGQTQAIEVSTRGGRACPHHCRRLNRRSDGEILTENHVVECRMAVGGWENQALLGLSDKILKSRGASAPTVRESLPFIPIIKCSIIHEVFRSTIQVLQQTAKLLCWYFIDDCPMNGPHYCYYTKACMSTLIHLPSLPTLDRESHTVRGLGLGRSMPIWKH